jgi:hypothetical protein
MLPLRRVQDEHVVASNAKEEEGLGEQVLVHRASAQLALHLGFGGLEVSTCLDSGMLLPAFCTTRGSYFLLVHMFPFQFNQQHSFYVQ